MARTQNNPGYTGYPALFFLGTLHDGRGDQKLSQRMISLEKRYSYLRAYLPVYYERNEKLRLEYSEKISPLLSDLMREVDAMGDQYNSVYEGESGSGLKKDFLKVMRGVRERIDQLAALTGIVDKIATDDEEMMF